MNLSIDLLSDYNNLYYSINDQVLQHKNSMFKIITSKFKTNVNKTLKQSDFELYLTPIDSANDPSKLIS